KPLTVAILDGAQQIAVPALAATLTICVVFFPVVLLEGPARFLFTPLALGVVISMMASYLLSRTLVPTLARILMEKEALHPEGERARLEHRSQEMIPPAELDTINSNSGMPISCKQALVQTDNTASQDADLLIAVKATHAPTERYMQRIRRELRDEFPGVTMYF